MIRNFCEEQARGVRRDEVPPAARGLSQGGPGGGAPPGKKKIKEISQIVELIFLIIFSTTNASTRARTDAVDSSRAKRMIDVTTATGLCSEGVGSCPDKRDCRR